MAVLMKYLRVFVFFLSTLLLYLGLPLFGWGCDNLRGFFSLAPRLGYALSAVFGRSRIGDRAFDCVPLVAWAGCCGGSPWRPAFPNPRRGNSPAQGIRQGLGDVSSNLLAVVSGFFLTPVKGKREVRSKDTLGNHLFEGQG